MKTMFKGKKLDSISSKKTDKKKYNESKIKLIKRIAGRADWVGDLTEIRKSRYDLEFT